jgi:hypothetical protein
MSTSVDRAKINRILQREAALIARVAHHELLPQIAGMLAGMQLGDVGAATGGPHGLPSGVGPDELGAMVEQGFHRLGALVGFSVLVDEPELIADDLEWLRDMLGVRGVRHVDAEWMSKLVGAYTGAARSVLGEDEHTVICNTTGRALAILRERLNASEDSEDRP